MIFKMLKMMVTRGAYDREDITKKMDVFLLNDRIAEAEYTEVIELMG